MFESLHANGRARSEIRNSKFQTRKQAGGTARVWSFGSRICAWLAHLAGLLVVLASPIAARGQGCAMCYTTAASAHAAAIQALRSGVLILLVPPLVMMGVILIVVYRYRNRFNPAPAGLPWTAEEEQELSEMLAQMENATTERPPVAIKHGMDRSRIAVGPGLAPAKAAPRSGPTYLNSGICQ
jgi:hypothetical protein